METIAFYSYKGGVGRTLLLANAARFLATLGKGVVALDFDFEAPGLHYKLAGVHGTESNRLPKGGAVPYLAATAEGSASPPALDAHMISIAVPSDAKGWLRLMPAGPAPHQSYWAAFKEVGEKLRLGDHNGQGFMALLDLRARIAEELKPDYLLIDARTGVTDLGGIATTILADTVVCMFVANQESLDGTLAVVDALKASPRLAKQKPVRVVPLQSRATAKLTDDDRFASGIKRLLKLGEGKKTGSKSELALFALPHDDVLGASDRVVAGERNASAFSPLYQAYLELFQGLFPAHAESARHVLERLEAVAKLREELTSSDRHRYGFDVLSPWNDSLLQEGVLVKAEQHRGKGTRYADLVCRNQAGHALMIVEYVVDESTKEALEFWNTSSTAGCVVLLTRNQHGYIEKQIFTRSPNARELCPTERRDLPRPREFELLRDVGDRSVESMLDAVRHGHIEAVTWLVNEWRESTMGMSMQRGPSWRPERARRILDGLAATEDLRCSEEILRRAAPDNYDDDWRGRSRKFHKMMEEMPEPRMAEDLFAPLFWRLPVEAVLESMQPKRHPGESLSLAGYRLLAHDLMGLLYDPDQNALEEAISVAARLPQSKDQNEDGDSSTLRWIHRSRWKRIEDLRLSDEVPPALVWEETLREERYWRATFEEAKDKVGDKAKEVLKSNAKLRSRLKEMAGRGGLATQGLLGNYDASGRLELFPSVIAATAEVLELSPRYLKSVVFIHLSTWALAHQGRDLDGQLGYGFAPTPHATVFHRESPTHVMLVQGFTDRLIHRLQDPNLQAAFEKLSKHQPEPYTRWGAMRKMSLERLRMLLLTARASASALGLPGEGQ